MLHLTYTKTDLPQQLTQIDHLTKSLLDRLNEGMMGNGSMEFQKREEPAPRTVSEKVDYFH
jgi:hypothetical protein